MREGLLSSRTFYMSLISLAIPIAIQSLITSSLGMVDSIMVGQLGAASIASVGVGNKITQVLTLILQGFGSGAAIFAAQYWGRKDRNGIKKMLFLSFLIMGMVSLVFTLFISIFPNVFVSIFTNDPDVVGPSSQFLRILSISYFFTALTILFATILKTMGEVRVPLYISILAIGLNSGLNYFVIFGHMGFPRLGIEGAAMATCLARVIQCLLLFFLILKHLNISIRGFNWRKAFDVPLFKDYLTVAIPSIINHTFWTLGQTAYFWIYAHMGTDQLAAVTLIDPLLSFFMAWFIGLSDAASVMVGNSIGADDEERAFANAKRFVLLTFLFSLVAGLAVFFASPVFISIYNVNAEVVHFAHAILLTYIFIISAQMLNMVNNIGVLRAGGDTKFVMYLDMLGVWLVGLPLAAGGAFVFHLPIFIVYGLANSHEYARAVIGIRRTLSKKWIRKIAKPIPITAN